jgi:diadenosine tetraphosphate (Ap4A) HIT family hydrolase
MVMGELASGWAVIGDSQFLPGYSLLVSRHREAQKLSDLTREQRIQFLSDLDLLATAVERACEQKDPSLRRVNIEILGNNDHYVHAHVFPRYEWEGPRATDPVWLYGEDHWAHDLHAYKPGHEPLRAAIAETLAQLTDVTQLAGREARASDPSDQLSSG